jgi:hypothetical protein
MNLGQKEVISCPFCKTKHMKINKSRHLRSKFCKSYQRANDIIKDFVIYYKKGESLDSKILTPYKNDKGDIVYLSDKHINLMKNINEIL